MSWVFEHGQFRHLTQPYNEVMGIAQAHMHGVVQVLREHPEIDLVHDHLEVVGPGVLSATGRDAAPGAADTALGRWEAPDLL